MTDYEHVMKVGSAIVLSDCAYGEWKGQYISTPHRYYFFLAGLIRLNDFTRILEIGTHYGGSTLAMSKGLTPEHADTARIVTVDIARHNEAPLAAVPSITRIQGDSLAARTVEKACGSFAGDIDLLFVDARHEHRDTLENVALYANRLKPKMIVLDDINLTDGMRELWSSASTRATLLTSRSWSIARAPASA